MLIGRFFVRILTVLSQEEIEIKLNKEKQKLIRLVAVKSDKKFYKTNEENVKIGAVICNTKWKMTGKICA